MGVTTNVPSKPMPKGGNVIVKSPLKDQIRTGNTSTMRDKKGKKGY